MDGKPLAVKRTEAERSEQDEEELDLSPEDEADKGLGGRRLPLDGPGLRRGLTSLWAPVLFYLASRVVTVAGMAIAGVLRAGLGFVDTFTRWDSAWYLDAATNGYASRVPEIAGRARYSNVPFFPLFPAMIRGVSRVTGLSALRSGLLVAFLFGLAATLLLWVLTERLCGKDAADRTTALFCFFPGSFVMSLVYAEPVMLTLALCCLLALLTRRWLAAGVASALATASRPNAVALVPCCLWAAVGAIRERREWRALVAPLLAPLGIIGFFVFLWRRTGEATAWFRVQRQAWNEHFDLGITTVKRFVRVIQNPFADVNSLLAALGLVFVVVAGVMLARSRLPAVLYIYTAVIIALALGSTVLGARPRFVWTAFPLLMAVGQRLKGNNFTLAVGTLAALLGCLTVLSVASQAIPVTLEAIP